MAEFNIDDLRFPATADKVVNKGDILEIDVKIEGIGLEHPIVFDMDKRKGFITLVDNESNIYSIPCKLISKIEDIRTRSGNYVFKASIITKKMAVGDVRVIGRVYDLIGAPVFIRQRHRIV